MIVPSSLELFTAHTRYEVALSEYNDLVKKLPDISFKNCLLLDLYDLKQDLHDFCYRKFINIEIKIDDKNLVLRLKCNRELIIQLSEIFIRFRFEPDLRRKYGEIPTPL